MLRVDRQRLLGADRRERARGVAVALLVAGLGLRRALDDVGQPVLAPVRLTLGVAAAVLDDGFGRGVRRLRVLRSRRIAGLQAFFWGKKVVQGF